MAAPRIRTRSLRPRRPPAALANGRPGSDGGFSGPVRLGKRTKRLVKRIGAGDVAIIDHAGIDRVSGEDLVAAGVKHVVNVAQSVAPHYANRGPSILVESGVKLVDMPGAPLFDLLDDGDEVTLDGGKLIRDGEVLWEGEVLDAERVERAYEEAERRIGEALEAFAENTMTHIREERELLSGEIQLPDFDTSFRDRPVLVVVRGVDHKRDLRILRPYVRETRPAIVAVDGGANAILEEGLKPDMIVGDMDSATDEALRCGAELVVHAYPDGRAPGRKRLDPMGLDYKVVPAPATSEDVALLVAAEKGASLIVSVGSHFNLVEFLDKNRAGMSSTFLTRLRVGEILVDAKGVSRLYRPSAGRGPILLVTAAAFATLVVVVATSDTLGPLLDLLWLKLEVLLGLE
ncbi:MAG: putative cytokinetic ring protein SteA [Actinomycetota bacterium]|nr:putative cytokinetic ring protein SteA [Actinomycetota bacterium]